MSIFDKISLKFIKFLLHVLTNEGEIIVDKSPDNTVEDEEAKEAGSSGGSIIETPDKSQMFISGRKLLLLIVEVMARDVWGVAKTLELFSPLALLPGVPIVAFNVLLNPELVLDNEEGVIVWIVWLIWRGVDGIPNTWALFLATDALQESSNGAGRGLIRSCLAWLENRSVFTVSLMSLFDDETQEIIVIKQWGSRHSFNTFVKAESL